MEGGAPFRTEFVRFGPLTTTTTTTTNLTPRMASSRATPELPQEIIDQIIDELAYSDHDSDPQLRRDTLKACALVSRRFNGRSRRHIFSMVNLIIDTFAQKRAGRLLEILRKEDNRASLVQNIHQFEVLFDFRNSDAIPSFFILSGMTKPFIKARNLILRSLESIGLREHRINQVLDIMADTPLNHFGLGSRRGFIKWTAQKRDIDDKLLRIIAKPSLKTLHLHNLVDLPEIYVRDAFQSTSITGINLSYLRFSRGDILPSPRSDAPFPLARLEKMELRFISYKELLSIICRTMELAGYPGPSDFPTPRMRPIYSLFFSSLQTLVVWIPKAAGELGALWDILQSAAPSLTNLKIESHGHIDAPSLEPINLSPFRALKRLEFSLILFREDTDMGIQEMSFANLLSSATLPMSLESINLTIALGSNGNLGVVLRPSDGWNLLDNALNNPLFVKLKSVVFDVKTAINNQGIKDVQMSETSKLLPIMSASPSVDTRIYIRVVNSIQALLPGYHFELR